MRALTLHLGRLTAMTTDDLAIIHRRLIQVFAVGSLVAALVGAGVYGGRLLSSLDSLTASVTELRTEVRASAQAAAADRYELRALRERVERLERASAP